jgi:hypothetical protein
MLNEPGEEPHGEDGGVLPADGAEAKEEGGHGVANVKVQRVLPHDLARENSDRLTAEMQCGRC